MPKKKLKFLPGMENAKVNCFAYYVTRSGEPSCKALKEIYCLKEHGPCAFYATPAQAAKDVIRARKRLEMQP